MGNPSEIEAEIERLLRELYVEVPSEQGRSADVSVALEPIERRGLSPAVVVNCIVEPACPALIRYMKGIRRS